MSKVKQESKQQVEESTPKTKYKVVGFGYQRPKKYIDARGEVVMGSEWIQYIQGGVAYFMIAPKKIVSIVYDDSTRSFRVYFEKGGLRIIPYSPDMEVDYIEEN